MRLLLIFLFPFSLTAQSVVDSLIVKHEQFIYFESNEHSLDSEDLDVINNLITKAKTEESFKYFVDAYTDDVGSLDFNLKLSEKRKESVLSVLRNNNIADSLIISNYHGESSPVTTKTDEASRQLNRRVTILLLEKVPFVEVNGVVKDDETGEPISTEVILSSKDFSTTVNTNQDGVFSALAPLGINLLIEVTAEDYFIKSKVIKTTKALIGKVIQLPLPKATLGKTFELENLFFVGNSPRILYKSRSTLNQIQRFMFVNAKACIEIAGHVNAPFVPPVKKGTFDLNLSIARANAIQDSLVKIGVSSDRILSRGYGNWQMKYPKAKTDAQMEKNRRVELIMSSCDSTAVILDDSFEGDLRAPSFNLAVKKIKVKSKLDELYNPATAADDLSQANSKAKRDIFAQLKKMSDAGMDPTKYSYKEILLAFPDLPKRKE